MKYTVKHGHEAVGTVAYYPELTKSEAIAIATELSHGKKQVYVSWYRKSDGQQGYLNRDGNHAITGNAW